MPRKFELPTDFKVSKNNNEYHVKIIEKNPIWVVLSASFIGAGIVLTYLSIWCLLFCGLGILKLIIEYKKHSNIVLTATGFIINNQSFEFDTIKRIMVDSDNYNGGSFVSRGDFKVSYISIETKTDKHKGIGKRMIVDYQHALVYILRQFHKGNQKFIEALPNL